MLHELKILPHFFHDVLNCRKTFELRKDDRPYRVGDTLKLLEFDGQNLTGRYVAMKVTYLLRDAEEYGLKKGFAIIGIKELD